MRRSSHFLAAAHLPALLWAALSAQAAAYVVTSTVGRSSFSLLAHLALLAGFALSMGNLRWRRPLDLVGYAALVGSFVLFATRQADNALGGLLYPAPAMVETNLATAVLLLWLLAAFGLLQYRPGNLVFVSACGLAIFGTIAVINLEPGVLIAFAVYLFTTILAWAHDALTRRAELPPGVEPWALVRGQAVTGATLFTTVVIAALLVGSLAHWAVPNPFGESSRFRPLSGWAGTLFQGGLFVSDQLAVGAGPVNLPEDVLFLVRSDYPDLWRVAAYDQYDGHSWRQTVAGSYRLPRSEDGAFHLPGGVPADADLNHQWIEPQIYTTSRIPAAAQPVLARPAVSNRLGPGTSMLLDAYGCLSVAPATLPGAAYEVVSALSETDPDLLRAAGEEYPHSIRYLYLAELPLATTTELASLVAEVTAGQTTAYDKAVAIQRFLEREYFYSDQAPATPRYQDAAVYFLLETRRGACDLFATAMAVMLRMAAVPCRVATGYQSSDYDLEASAWVLRASDAHAWVEVFFPGYGWVAFNPSAAEELESQPWWELITRGQGRWVLQRLARTAGVGLMSLVLLVLLVMAVADPRLLGAHWLDLQARRDPWERVGRECRRTAARAAAAAHGQMRPGHTPLELLRQAESRPGAATVLLPRLRELIGEFYALRYSAGEPREQRLRALGRELRTLRRRLPRPRRRTEDAGGCAPPPGP